MAHWLKCCFTSTETVGLSGTGVQLVHLNIHTAPELEASLRGPVVYVGPWLIPHRGPAASGPQEETSDRWWAARSPEGDIVLLLSHFGGVQ